MLSIWAFLPKWKHRITHLEQKIDFLSQSCRCEHFAVSSDFRKHVTFPGLYFTPNCQNLGSESSLIVAKLERVKDGICKHKSGEYVAEELLKIHPLNSCKAIRGLFGLRQCDQSRISTKLLRSTTICKWNTSIPSANIYWSCSWIWGLLRSVWHSGAEFEWDHPIRHLIFRQFKFRLWQQRASQIKQGSFRANSTNFWQTTNAVCYLWRLHALQSWLGSPVSDFRSIEAQVRIS